MKKLSLSFCVFLCFSMSALAQNNARIQGMGNCDIVPDINRTIYYNPAYMNDYKDQAQVSFNSPIIGIKSLGSMFSLGAILNRGLLLDNSFYIGGKTLLPNVDTANTYIPYIPHFLFGIDLSGVKLGLDFFWEHAAFSSTTTSTTSTTGQTTKTTEAQNINNIGGLIGANFKISEVDLGVLAGYGSPNIHRKSDNGTTVTEAKSEKGSYFRLGAEAQFPVGSFNGTVGANFDALEYQFVTMAGVKQNDNSRNTLTPYLGVTKEIADKLLIVLMEKSFLDFHKYTAVSGSSTASLDSLRHILSAGLEKQFASVGIVDSLGLRAGLSWSITNHLAHQDATVLTVNTKTDVGYTTSMGPALPYVGFGVAKSLFSLDLVIDPAAWAGLFNGPDVARATLSLKF